MEQTPTCGSGRFCGVRGGWHSLGPYSCQEGEKCALCRWCWWSTTSPTLEDRTFRFSLGIFQRRVVHAKPESMCLERTCEAREAGDRGHRTGSFPWICTHGFSGKYEPSQIQKRLDFQVLVALPAGTLTACRRWPGTKHQRRSLPVSAPPAVGNVRLWDHHNPCCIIWNRCWGPDGSEVKRCLALPFGVTSGCP